MPFVKMPGVVGKVFIPETKIAKKHNCIDCFCCQWCSDERCELCLRLKKDRKSLLPSEGSVNS